MSEVTAAAPQPAAPEAQSSGGSKSGSDNLTGAQLAQRFMKAESAPIAPAAEQVVQATAPEQTPAAEGTTETPAEAQPAETAPAQAEAAPAGEADDVLSPKTTFTPEQQEIFNKRLGKEIDKRRIAEEERETLRQQLANAKLAPDPTTQPIVPLPQGAPPLANIHDMQGLVALQQQAKEAVRWGEEQLDREDFDSNPPVDPASQQPFTKAQIKAAMRNAKLTMEDHIPQRAQFLTARQNFLQQAYEAFPYLKDKSSPEYQEVQTAYRTYPWLHSLPNAEFILGVQMEGMRVLEARQAAAKAKANGTQPVAPKSTVKPLGSQAATSSSSTAVRVPGNTATRQAITAEKEKLTAKGGVTGKDYAAFLSRKEQLRNSR